LAGDGHYNKAQGCIIICTDSFSVEQVDQLREILLTKYLIGSTRVLSGNPTKNQYRIRIPKKEVGKVQDIVKNHIPSCMQSRVGL
jgi:hypothetical protein